MEFVDQFIAFARSLGVHGGQHVLVHASYRRVRSAFPGLTIEGLLRGLQEIITPSGSIIIPAFTYCFKRTDGTSEVFRRSDTPSVVGALSEVFRTMAGVVRTSSPTHSFVLWGKVTEEVSPLNNPASPLGEGSVLDWLARQQHSSVLMLGTGFSSLSLGHYIELKAPVPWVNYSPWPEKDRLNVGVAETGEIELREVPRCSRQFVAFERDLGERGIIAPGSHGPLDAYLLPVRVLLVEGVVFFRRHPERLLCPEGMCAVCDARRERFLRAEANSAGES